MTRAAQPARTPRFRWPRWAGAILALFAAVALFVLDFDAHPEWGLSIPQSGLLAAGLLLCEWVLLPIGRAERLLLLGSIVAILIAAEAGLRRFLPTRFVSIIQTDEACLHRYAPNARKVFAHHERDGAGGVVVETNELGYRGEALSTAGERPRVAVFGDSFIAAEYTENSETFVEQVERALALRTGVTVECINCGVVAYGPDQSCVLMRHELPSLDADLAIVAIFAENDYGDLIRNKLFGLDAGGGLRALSPRLAPKLSRDIELARRSRLFSMSLDGGSRLRGNLARRLGRSGDAIDPLAHMRSWLERSKAAYADALTQSPIVVNLFEDHYDADVSLEPRAASAVYKVALMEAVVREITTTARHANVPLLFLVIPGRTDLLADHAGAPPDASAHPEYRRDTLSRHVVEAAASAGACCVDLYEPYRQAGPEGLYFEGNGHWNASGQALAAAVVADTLVARGWLGRAKVAPSGG